MIYDCFLFFNEFDCLDIRLHELADVVDRFVLLESTRTFTFKRKPLQFLNVEDNRFDWIRSRIDVVVPDDEFPGVDTTDPWAVEAGHRNCLMELAYCRDHDMVMLSDVDEIPSADFVRNAWYHLKANRSADVFCGDQWFANYYLNCIRDSMWTAGTRATSGRVMRGVSGEALRKASGTSVRSPAGWHFTYMGDVQEKLAAFSHAKYNKPPFNTPEHIARCKADRQDLFGRPGKSMRVTQNLSFLPQYVQDNLDKFEHLIYREPQ